MKKLNPERRRWLYRPDRKIARTSAIKTETSTIYKKTYSTNPGQSKFANTLYDNAPEGWSAYILNATLTAGLDFDVTERIFS